jgi:CelD/BcsL family acetyltransferase involved in cellulose biosynthesis
MPSGCSGAWSTGPQLRAHWLRLGDRIVAYVIVLHHANTAFAYFNAIDPAAERYHPGSLILAETIEHEATEHGALVIDMMVGANLTKTLLATEELHHVSLSVVNPRHLRSRATGAWIRVARALTLRLHRR